MSREAAIRATIIVPPDVDTGASLAFLAGLDASLDSSVGEIVLDCSELRGANSSQVRVLWHARARCLAAGAAMRLVSVCPGLERVLKVLDLYALFTVETGLPAAGKETGARTRESVDREVFEVECEPSIPEIDKVTADFRSFLVQLGLNEMCTFDLGTVFYEIATNVRLHGSLGSGETLSFSAVRENGKMTLTFTDPGAAFDSANNAPKVNLREMVARRQNHGLGLALVARLMDSISYERVDGRNVVMLEKALKPERKCCNAGPEKD
jgi:serine/threonine-protein kinase RsbW